jgi:ribosomal protein S18 acetylase RimI-like enzyme
MADFHYREAHPDDIPAMAEIRAADWGTEDYWQQRIAEYLAGALHPKEALAGRVAFVCAEEESIVGFIAGHLTRRFGCSGELEWISVRPQYRNRGIASQLLCRLAEWFVANNARRVCVDVDPSNQSARRFYANHGARDMKPHWMVWQNIAQALEFDRSQ